MSAPNTLIQTVEADKYGPEYKYVPYGDNNGHPYYFEMQYGPEHGCIIVDGSECTGTPLSVEQAQATIELLTEYVKANPA